MDTLLEAHVAKSCNVCLYFHEKANRLFCFNLDNNHKTNNTELIPELELATENLREALVAVGIEPLIVASGRGLSSLVPGRSSGREPAGSLRTNGKTRCKKSGRRTPTRTRRAECEIQFLPGPQEVLMWSHSACLEVTTQRTGYLVGLGQPTAFWMKPHPGSFLNNLLREAPPRSTSFQPRMSLS